MATGSAEGIVGLGLLVGLASLFACGGGGGQGPWDNTRDQALVVTGDYQTGSFATIDRLTRRAVRDIRTIHPDAVCRVEPHSGRPFLVQRLGADSLVRLDPDQGWRVDLEFSTGAGSNPQDVAFAAMDRAYVPLYARPELLVVDPRDGRRLGSVDLAPWADADGTPEAAWALAVEGRVFVALQRLVSFQPAQDSLLLSLDADGGEVRGELALAARNPFARLRHAPGLGRLSLGLAGAFGVLDGGLELVDPDGLRSDGLVLTEAALGGDLVDAVVASPGRGYAIVAEGGLAQQARTRVVSFDPGQGRVLETLLQADSYAHAGLELSPDGEELWVADRTRSRPGVRVFSTRTDRELTGTPIDTGLPPVMICFVP
jgi:hypothetical protein